MRTGWFNSLYYFFDHDRGALPGQSTKWADFIFEKQGDGSWVMVIRDRLGRLVFLRHFFAILKIAISWGKIWQR